MGPAANDTVLYGLRLIGSAGGQIPAGNGWSYAGEPWLGSGIMARIVEHLSVAELGARYRAARDATEARHYQAIWLLAQGRTFLEVAEVLAFVPRWVEELAAHWRRATMRSAQRRWATNAGGTAAPPPC